MNELTPIIWLFICGIPSLILWIIMLSIMDSKGENVNYFFVTPGQYIRFWKIVKVEKQTSKRRKYLIIFWTQIAIIPIYMIGGILIIKNII
ncbi:MAG: hypothetical protein COW63_04055 [Bacteroidetes bacterium CG18_big_fil_WC_8_21_14_2_50_41_14]|nr:MAG: hypothetical protein COW63_04055 [Bacteroidetes bacterium CG18_big_fil_WC_8_21_14_2_50_41_14]